MSAREALRIMPHEKRRLGKRMWEVALVMLVNLYFDPLVDTI